MVGADVLYRTVKTDIWLDPWFADLAPQSKCLFLYLFTNPRVSACGAMNVSLNQIAFETKIPVKKLGAELEAFGSKVLWLPEHSLIVVRNFYKHQRSKSSASYTDAAIKAMATLPDEARAWLVGVYPELNPGRGESEQAHTPPSPHPPPTMGGKEEALAVAKAEALTTAKATADTPPTPSRGKRKSVLTDLPDDFTVTEAMRQWAREKHKLTDAEIDVKTDHFLNYVHKTGKQYAKWEFAWRDSMTWDPRGSPQPLRPIRPPLPPGWSQSKMDEAIAYREAGVVMPPEREAAVDAYLAAMKGAAA